MDRLLSAKNMLIITLEPGRSRSGEIVSDFAPWKRRRFEETLQEYDNMEVREAHASMGSSKFRQRLMLQAAQVPSKPARAVRAIHVESESSRSEVDSGGSDTDSDRRNVYMAAAADRA